MGGLVEGQGEFTWKEDTGLLTDAVTQSLRFKGLTTANIFSTVPGGDDKLNSRRNRMRHAIGIEVGTYYSA